MAGGGASLQVWWGRRSDHASLVLLVLFLLHKHLMRASNAAPVNRLPFVAHQLLHILLVCVRRACGPKVGHHLCVLCNNIPLT